MRQTTTAAVPAHGRMPKAQHDGNFADMSVHYYCGSDGIYQAAEHTCKCWHIGREYDAALDCHQ